MSEHCTSQVPWTVRRAKNRREIEHLNVDTHIKLTFDLLFFLYSSCGVKRGKLIDSSSFMLNRLLFSDVFELATLCV